ncbi:hypothetical protein DAI22_04g092300 [Oryza sativa Japonica Group]|nr:hypothetical protein DAI22_04g092300 [Oryza sativa Japonica Group]
MGHVKRQQSTTTTVFEVKRFSVCSYCYSIKLLDYHGFVRWVAIGSDGGVACPQSEMCTYVQSRIVMSLCVQSRIAT